jgi:hypothetical protein
VFFLDLHSLCWLSRNGVGWSDGKRCRENRTPPHNNLTLLSYFLPIVFCFFLLLVSGIFFLFSAHIHSCHFSLNHTVDYHSFIFISEAAIDSFNPFLWHRGQGNSVSIVSDYRLDDWVIGARSPAEAVDFSSSLCVQTGSEAIPASCPMGTGVVSLGVKHGWGMTVHSPPFSSKVKNE